MNFFKLKQNFIFRNKHVVVVKYLWVRVQINSKKKKKRIYDNKSNFNVIYFQ